MPKQAQVKAIKLYHCYTLSEAAELIGVSKRTLHNWGKKGLPIMDCAKPALVRGDDLRSHILKQRQDAKTKLKLCEFYCLRCRAKRDPAGGMADCAIIQSRAKLTALCAICETVVCKPVPLARLSEIRSTLDLSIKGDGAAL